MKKIIAILSLISIILLSTACDNKVSLSPDTWAGASNFNIVETKNIVLGSEVDSVVLTVKSGEQLTFDTTAEFFQIFDKIGFEGLKEDKKYSSSAEMKLNDESKTFVNMNHYCYGDAEFCEFRAKKEGDDNVVAIEEYAQLIKLENNLTAQSSFNRYAYKKELAFNGSVPTEDGSILYSSSRYPIIPASGTELNEMQSRSVRLRNLLGVTVFFANYEPYVSGDTTFDYNEFVTREYKLYENYIVFKQTAPFLSISHAFGRDFEIIHSIISSSNDSITQEAYCNVKTGEIELIKVYGNTRLHDAPYVGMPLEIDMQLYIHNVNESELALKIANLISYVKTNSDQQ